MPHLKVWSSKEISSPANKSFLDDLVTMVTISFLDDPVSLYCMGTSDRTSLINGTPVFWRTLLTAAISCDAQFAIMTDDETTRSKILSAGVLLPPKTHDRFAAAWTFFRSGGLKVIWKTGFGPLLRFGNEVGNELLGMHHRLYKGDDEHHFLFLMSTHPDARGQGLGKHILEEFQHHARKVAAGGPVKSIYLESSSRGSQRLYRRCGWIDRDEIKFGKIADGEDVVKDGTGRVLGARIYGMIWEQSS